MAAALSLQAWGVAGLDVDRDAPTERIGTIHVVGPDLIGLVIQNASGGAVADVVVSASISCTRDELHNIEVDSIADGQIAGPIILNHASDGARFAGTVYVDFGASWADLQVAAVRIGSLRGTGTSSVEAPAVGSSPGTIPLLGKDDELELETCSADGMQIDLPSGDVQLVVENGGGSTATIYLHSLRDCSQGFFEPEAVPIPAVSGRYTRTLGTRFTGGRLFVTYADEAGLAMAAVAQETFSA